MMKSPQHHFSLAVRRGALSIRLLINIASIAVVILTSRRVYSARSFINAGYIADDQEMVWGFGQYIPMLLLALALLTFCEAFHSWHEESPLADSESQV